MDDDNGISDNKPMKLNSTDISNDLSINLASLLKNLSQNSVSICDTPVTSISELNLERENFEININRNKSEGEDYCGVKSESFLNQLSSNDRILNIDYINGKRHKSQYDADINKSLQDVKLISRMTNSRFSSNFDALSSMQMQNISAIKSLLDNQNGQIYLLVKTDAVQAIDSSSNFTNLLDSNNYPHQMQFSPTEIGVDMATSDNCTTITNLNNSTLMLAAHQLQISNNLSTAELLQKLLESPQVTSSNNHLESIMTNHKIDDTSISSLAQTYRDSMNSDNINSQYYACSIDSNNDAEITLLVDEDNSAQNSQFQNNSSSVKQEKQILILKGNSKHESLPANGHIVTDSMKDHLTLFSNHNGSLEINNEIYNDVSNTFTTTSSVAIKKSHSNNKSQKRLKIKPSKTMETSGQSDSSSKAYSSNSPIFSMSVSQMDNSPSKECVNGEGEFKELKRKSSHNEVERRRRDRINTWISELQNMLPNNEKMTLNRSKSHILKAVYDYFRIQTDQFSDMQVKYEKLNAENRENVAIIKKLEAEKEVLLNQLQYINQAVTNTVKSTQESLNRTNINHYRVNSIEKIKVNQPYRITNIYSNNDVNKYSNSYIIDNQNKKRKLNENETLEKL